MGEPDPATACAPHLGHCQLSLPALCPPSVNPGPPGTGGHTINCAFLTSVDTSIGANEDNLIYTRGVVDDKRTPADIAAGCVPCQFQLEGAVITVTDAHGAEAMVTVTATD